jgi:tetratricopeptide (TPR) repeat protein
MAVYHPRTQSGVVHYSSPLDLPTKKIWSWGSDEDGLDWRAALSDNNSAYVEVQAGMFRDQETYGFLEPQESRSFSECWIPIRELGGVSRANPNAVLNLSRQVEKPDTVTLEVILNVTRELRNALVSILKDQQTVASARSSLSPRETFRKKFSGLPAKAAYTVRLQNKSGEIILQHTEGQYEFEGPSKIQTGKQQSFSYPPEESFGADDYLTIAAGQESNGELLAALKTYQRGLARFPDSISLNRAVGRLEVALKQYGAAMQHLSKALARASNDHEAAYYLGEALSADGRNREARIQWEFAQLSSSYHAAAMIALAALEAREGKREHALRILQEVVSNRHELVQAGCMEVALLRALRHKSEVRKRVAFWSQKDPTSSLLRYEANGLSAKDPALLAHLAADPERILEIAAEYMRFGLFDDALNVLSLKYPSGSQVISEPGVPPPNSHALIAYYRGFCLYALGKDGRADFEAGSRMPTTYIFPNRADSFPVLRRAIQVNPSDATAHFLLGSLYLSGGMNAPAMQEWEAARRITPDIPTLHRNMGYTLLRSGGPLEQAIELFREGMNYDPRNVDLILGLEEAMDKAGRPPDERVRALQSFPHLQSAPTALVFRLVRLLGDAREFDPAEKLLADRFFAKEEGGADVREIYVTLRLKRANALAASGQCGPALDIVRNLGEPVANLPFTARGLGPFVTSGPAKNAIKEIEALCR